MKIFGRNKEQFTEFPENDDKNYAAKRQIVLDKIQSELGISPLENPFEYVKNLQADFDYGKIKFTGEYYDVLGLEPPEDIEKIEHKPVDFESFVFSFVKSEEQ